MCKDVCVFNTITIIIIIFDYSVLCKNHIISSVYSNDTLSQNLSKITPPMVSPPHFCTVYCTFSACFILIFVFLSSYCMPFESIILKVWSMFTFCWFLAKCSHIYVYLWAMELECFIIDIIYCDISDSRPTIYTDRRKSRNSYLWIMYICHVVP